MSISHAERRLIENEMIFRRMNEKVEKDLEALDATHLEDGHADLVRDEDLLLYFRCECPDEDCTTRIPMSLNLYKDLHADRKIFIVAPNHQIDPIENILDKTEMYYVVKKNHSVKEPTGTLNATSVHNA
ncbi:MAG: hypothetical protein ABIP74_03730 [Candidatus Saccharimonas sp.]